MNEKTYEELIERRAALSAAVDQEDADLDAIEKEVREINEELERRAAEKADREAAEQKREELRKLVANGAGVPCEKENEERKNTMNIKELRSSQEYLNAWAEGIKTGRYDECRVLLTENAFDPGETDGVVPVPTFVESRIQGIFERNEILSRVRRTFVKGNLKVGFEVSSTGAVGHLEGEDPIDDEQLIIGTVTIIAAMLKKTILVSDELLDMHGQEFLDYLFDEFENKIESALAAMVIEAIENAPDTSTASAVGIPVSEITTLSLDVIAQAMALLTNTVTNPCIVMNRGTYAAFRAEQLTANYAVDPFEGLPIVYSSALPSITDASDDDTVIIVGDLSAVTINFPAGDQVKFIYDPYTNAPSDLVRITGRLYAGVGVTTPGKLAKVVIEE
ncbi:MAG: phage major capsid protein [Lachnospiraceae bacterium]|nr:phage major capsid protein [Lachnospiraceae bacterium]